MGYRNYICSLPKTEHDKIKDLTSEELCQLKECDEDDYISIHDFNIKELHEFGKYVEFGDEKFYKPFFSNEETQEYVADEHEFYIVDKEFLKHIIEHYNGIVKKWYEDLLPNDDILPKDLTEKQLESIYNHIRSVKSEWCYLTPYNLEKGDEVTNSWKYEYSIFELVRLYKHFDFENNVIVYYGY